MEHRVLHMSVHCRAGMHEYTRKSTRYRRRLCSCERLTPDKQLEHQSVTPNNLPVYRRLKIDFDTDLTPNITRHSCIISAELVVSSFINNLVRLSSIVPFHIYLSNKLILITEGITLHTNTTTLRHFFTLWLSILTFPAFSTCAYWCRKFMSRIFDCPVLSCLAFSVATIVSVISATTQRWPWSSSSATQDKLKCSDIKIVVRQNTQADLYRLWDQFP